MGSFTIYLSQVSIFRACYTYPCKNGAKCIDHGNRYTCQCEKDYTGYDCETGKLSW